MDNLFLVSVLSMASLAIIFAAILGLADKKLKVEEDPRITEINGLLPAVNCGACGYVSCHDYAEHIVKEGVDPGRCRVMSEANREKLLSIMGAGDGEVRPVVPLVHCAAETGNKEPVASYSGIKTCRAANLAFGGGMQCQYGCLGFGDCTRVCPFDALHMENGLPRVDLEKCTGCGKCVTACPRGIITMQEREFEKIFYVACNSRDGALRVRQVCGVGCIACGICQKLSPEGYFKVEDNLSRAEHSRHSKQADVRGISGKCPTKVIKEI